MPKSNVSFQLDKLSTKCSSLKNTSNTIRKSCNKDNEFKSFEEERYPSSISPDYMKDYSNWNHLCHDSPSATMNEQVMLLHNKVSQIVYLLVYIYESNL